MIGNTPGAPARGKVSRAFGNKRIARSLLAASATAVVSAFFTPQASAQSFTQAIIFGDSTVDSGFYKAIGNPGGGAAFNNAFAAAIAAGGTGAPTSAGAPVNSQILAGFFGLTADPANQPGGTNFATSGAKGVIVNTPANGGFGSAIPTATQISNYLAANGGHANRNGLYLISSGGNDVSFAFGGFPTSPVTQADKVAFLVDQANGLSSAIRTLSLAGARTIIVPDQPFSMPTSSLRRDAALAYSHALWSGLSANGVNFIPADYNALISSVIANPSAFGFQFVGTNQAACTIPTVPNPNAPPATVQLTTAFSLLCIANPQAGPAQSHLKASADAGQTHLFADDQHLAAARDKRSRRTIITASWWHPVRFPFWRKTPCKLARSRWPAFRIRSESPGNGRRRGSTSGSMAMYPA